MVKLRRCWVCGAEHKRISKFCSRFCFEWNKKNLNKLRSEVLKNESKA